MKEVERNRQTREMAFWRIHDDLNKAVKHIPEAVSGSEVDTDLDYIENRVRKLKKLREMIKSA